MSYAWSFHSFSRDEFERLFGGSTPDEIDGFVEFAGAELDAETLARATLTSGISYAGLDADDAQTLDEIVKLAFSPEGFDETLVLNHLSPDGLHPTVIKELISRSAAPRYLLLLLSGRRFGAQTPSSCEYCIFEPPEVVAALDEIRAAAAAPAAWSQPYMQELVDQCLIGPFAAAAEEGRPLYAQLS